MTAAWRDAGIEMTGNALRHRGLIAGSEMRLCEGVPLRD